jgi:succinate dehydrogenase hydrophobic anchor subunit
MLGELVQEQAQQSYLMISLPAVIVVLLVFGFVSLAYLWRKGKSTEALSLLNSPLGNNHSVADISASRLTMHSLIHGFKTILFVDYCVSR